MAKSMSKKPKVETEEKDLAPQTDDKDIKNLQKESEVQKDNKDKEIEDLKKQIANLTKMMMEQNSKPTDSVIAETKIQSDDLVPVISQTVGELTLSTDGRGSGALYTFMEFGEIQDIDFKDLRDIVRNNRGMVNKGRFYILDKNAVKELRLESLYNKLLDNDEIETIFDKDADKIVDIYDLATSGQQEMIIDLIVDRKLSGKPIDANILTSLGNRCGKDLINIGD